MNFTESEKQLDDLKDLKAETLEPEPHRLSSPAAAVALYDTLANADDNSAYNRSLIQGQMDFAAPHDDAELENKGQGDRFNITTGEGPAIKNEAVAAFMDIYTTPKLLVDIPLKPSIDRSKAAIWSPILAEEWTTMDRGTDEALIFHNQLCDVYVTHGISFGYFEDPYTLQYSVAGLDHFKLPRSSSIITSKLPLVTALGSYQITDLYSKIGGDGWNEEAIKRVIRNGAKAKKPDWDNWELIQRDIKANEIYVDNVCDPIEVVHVWVKELKTGKISYYIAAKYGYDTDDTKGIDFLFKQEDYYESWDQCLQMFAFSVGNGGKVYTVRGLGYLIYQLANAMDIMHNKLLDNARVGSSFMIQGQSIEDLQDAKIVDAGGFIWLPPTIKIPEKQFSQNLNNALIPAINESRAIMNRSTGGLAAGDVLNDDKDRQTKLEVSSKLDYINKLNAFAISLYYGPYDKLMREKVRRSFTVEQRDPLAKKRVEEMKARILARGVPAEVFEQIDFARVKAARIIGTGSRASRILLYDQIQQMFPEMDAPGRKAFVYDYLVELAGVEKADRYLGPQGAERTPMDYQIAKLENDLLLEGDYISFWEGEDKLVHLGVHVDELEVGLVDVDEGRLDLVEWTMEHQQLYRHAIETLENTSVHETLQPQLNTLTQRLQQIGEIVVNGIKKMNAEVRKGNMAPPNGENGENPEDPEAQKKAAELQMEKEEHDAKLAQSWQMHLAKLEQIKQSGQQKQVLAAQDAMSKIVARDADMQAKIRQMRLKQN